MEGVSAWNDKPVIPGLSEESTEEKKTDKKRGIRFWFLSIPRIVRELFVGPSP